MACCLNRCLQKLDSMDLAVAYSECARITRHEARNFYFAFLSLPKRQRRSVYALYAFCREADDLVDAHPRSADEDALVELRVRLDQAAHGRPSTLRDFALADTIQRYGVDPRDLDAVLLGMQMDLDVSRIPDEEALDTYCYHVASAVGLATLPILTRGEPPTSAMRKAAGRLGKGMQIVNILRDVAEDLARDRVYLPATVLQRHGVSGATWNTPAASTSLRATMAELAEQAKAHLMDGRLLIRLLPSEARACPWLLAEIYQRILARIQSHAYDVFSQRIALPRHEKMWLLTSTLWRVR